MTPVWVRTSSACRSAEAAIFSDARAILKEGRAAGAYAPRLHSHDVQ